MQTHSALACRQARLDALGLHLRLFEIGLSDLRSQSIEAIAWSIREVYPAIGGFTVVIPTYDPGMKLFRAVKLDEKPGKISRISYPPRHLVSEYGRLNRPGQPVFYCSTHVDPPHFEVGLAAGDHGVMSQWITTDKLIVNHLGFSEDIIGQARNGRDLPEWHAPKGEKELNRIFRQWMAKKFASEVSDLSKWEYKLTIALKEVADQNVFGSAFIDRTRFDGFIYPSMGMWMKGDNLALKTTFVDAYLRLERVEYFVVEDIGARTITTKPLDFASN